MQTDGNNLSVTNRERGRAHTESVKASLGSDVVQWMKQAPYLEREEEHDLARKWHSEHDDAALHKIAAAHARLVVALAVRFKRFNLPLADLVQEGYIGLLEAAARFDPSREVRFSTYATWWIRASIQDYILKNWSIVRGGTSSAQKALFFNLRRLRIQIAQEDGNLSKQEIYHKIATQLGVSVGDVETMDTRLSGLDNSLDAPVVDNEATGMTQMDMLVDDSPLQDERIEHEIDNQRQTQWLNDSLKVLNERELHVIRARRLSDNIATLEALGETLGVTKERVRQIETRALEKLRVALSCRDGQVGKKFVNQQKSLL